MSTKTEFTFPPFRSEKWLDSFLSTPYIFPGVLDNINLTPDYMAANPAAIMYPNKANETKEQIRRTLFRHALFKIQNVEVTASCKDDRVLSQVVAAGASSSLSGSLLDLFVHDKTTKFLSEEVWSVNRCGEDHKYFVRYYKEGEDGFSTRIIPKGFVDKWAMFRFYFA